MSSSFSTSMSRLDFQKAQRLEPDPWALESLEHQKTLLQLIRPYQEKVNEKGYGIRTDDYFEVCFEFFKVTGSVVRVDDVRRFYNKTKIHLRRLLEEGIQVRNLSPSDLESLLKSWDLYDSFKFYRVKLKRTEEELRAGQAWKGLGAPGAPPVAHGHCVMIPARPPAQESSAMIPEFYTMTSDLPESSYQFQESSDWFVPGAVYYEFPNPGAHGFQAQSQEFANFPVPAAPGLSATAPEAPSKPKKLRGPYKKTLLAGGVKKPNNRRLKYGRINQGPMCDHSDCHCGFRVTIKKTENFNRIFEIPALQLPNYSNYPITPITVTLPPRV